MNNQWRQSEQELSSTKKTKIPTYTRYNMSFKPNQTHLSMNQIKIQKTNRIVNSPKSKSCENQNNFVFTKYSYFPVHVGKHRELKSSIQIAKKNQQALKWVGVRQVNQLHLQQSFSNRNAFPQRKAKGSDQLLINMLLKYQKHYGRQNQQGLLNPIKSINVQEMQSARYLTKRQKKLQTRIKWFKALQKTSK